MTSVVVLAVCLMRGNRLCARQVAGGVYRIYDLKES